MNGIDDSVPEATVEAVLEFINAPNKEARRSVAEARWSDLNRTESDSVLAGLLERYKDSEQHLAFLRSMRFLLARCRNEGIRSAFSDPAPAFEKFSNEVHEAFHAFTNAPDSESARAIFERDREILFSDDAERLFDLAIDFFRDDSRLVNRLQERRRQLGVCRSEGPEAAFPPSALTISAPVAEAVSALLQAPSLAQLRAVLRIHGRELLSQEADHLLEFLTTPPTELGASEIQRLTECRALLARCRHEGLDAVLGKDEPATVSGEAEVNEDELKELHEELGKMGVGGVISERDIESLLASRPHLRRAWEHRRADLLGVQDSDTDRQRLTEILGELMAAEGDWSRQVELLKSALALPLTNQIGHLWATLQSQLGAALSQCPGENRAELIEESLEHHRLAQRIFSREAFPREWSANLLDMGNALVQRSSGDRAENVEEAIRCYEDALEVRRELGLLEENVGHLMNLGNAYTHRVHGSRRENLEQAIEHLTAALPLLDPRRQKEPWADVQLNLGNAYLRRVAGDRLENLERAIDHLESAREVYAGGNDAHRRGMINLSLGTVFFERVLGERQENYRKAISYIEESIGSLSSDLWPEKWAEAHNLLGSVLLGSVSSLGLDAAVDRAIELFQIALQIYDRRRYPTDWAKVQMNLGSAYTELARAGRQGAVEEAVRSYQTALEVYGRNDYPDRWSSLHFNLGLLYAKVARNGDPVAFAAADEHFRLALEARPLEALPAEHLDAQSNLARLHFESGGWEAADQALSAALEAGARLLESADTDESRRFEVDQSADLFAMDTYCLLRMQRPAEALLRLDQGKTRLLAEALALGGADLEGLSETDRETLREARSAVRGAEVELRDVSGASDRRARRELVEKVESARADLSRVVARVRSIQPDFLAASIDIEDFLSLVPSGGVLVAPFVTLRGGGAFVLRAGSRSVEISDVIWNDELTTGRLRRLLYGDAPSERPGGWLGAYFRMRKDFAGWLRTIEETGSVLYELLMGPVQERLAALGLVEGAPLVMIPQGGLGLLPLHASWRTVGGGRRYLIEDYAFSYAPGGYALAVSRRRAGEHQRSAGNVLVVADPTGDLPYARAEGEAVAALFSEPLQRSLAGEAATLPAIVDAASRASYIHFACHGFYNWNNPLRSGILLAGSTPVPLRLSDILSRIDLGATRLITLSACETGLSDVRRAPDEYLGLPAGFLQAGAPAVLGTLWPVKDLSTMLLMECFYTRHIQEGLPLAEALRRAQLWLYHATRAGLAEPLEAAFSRTSSEGSRAAERLRDLLAKHSDERPFAHPYYWAAFTMTGS